MSRICLVSGRHKIARYAQECPVLKEKQGTKGGIAPPALQTPLKPAQARRTPSRRTLAAARRLGLRA